jgi:hypothetical protein
MSIGLSRASVLRYEEAKFSARELITAINSQLQEQKAAVVLEPDRALDVYVDELLDV